MKRILFAGLCMAALATSCSENLEEGGVSTHTASTQTVSLSASVNTENTRVAFDEDGNFYWQKGDQIGVWTTNADDPKFAPLDLTTDPGKASATFTGTIAGEMGDYAIYPYSADQKLSESTLTYTFPKSYEYAAVDTTFVPEKKDGNSFKPAMYAKIVNDKVAFKHLGGVFCIKISSMPCESGTLTLATDQKLCGAFTTSLTEGTPELKTEDETVTEGNTVSIAFTNATLNKPGVFYIPVPTGTYTNTSVTLKTQTDDELTETKTVLTVNAGKYEVKRADLKKIELKTVTIETEDNAETTKEVALLEDLTEALRTIDNVTLIPRLSKSPTITIPKVTTENNKPKTLTLAGAHEHQTVITVTEETASTGESVESIKDFTLSFPDMERTMDVKLSTNTTLTLAAKDGTATINAVNAGTAKILIVDNGVTINTLTLYTGCQVVRINKGAKVDKIVPYEGTKPIVYCEEGATLPAGIENLENVTVKKIPVGGSIN